MTTENAKHERFMSQALAHALRGWGRTHPNPVVGAIIVEDGKIVAKGAHLKAGEAHAERVALEALARKPNCGAVIYVTLEPCSTAGRTPPCTDLIIDSGIKTVVFGSVDPNPRHAGKAIGILESAGIEVISGVLEDECDDLNLIFNYNMRHEAPLFAAKFATTIDGRIATRHGDSKWITGEIARQDVMRWRKYFPAIAVGAGTVLLDDPTLTIRLDGEDEDCARRFVFDHSLDTADQDCRLYKDSFLDKTVVVTQEEVDSQKVKKLEAKGVSVWQFPSEDNNISLKSFRQKCWEENIYGVYFEGGARVLSQLIKQRQLDYLFAYRAPKFLADEKSTPSLSGVETELMRDAFSLTEVRHATFGCDQLMRGFVES